MTLSYSNFRYCEGLKPITSGVLSVPSGAALNGLSTTRERNWLLSSGSPASAAVAPPLIPSPWWKYGLL